MKTKAANAGAKAAAVAKSGKASPTLRATLPGMSYSAHRIEFSPDGKFLASGGHGDGHRLWRAPDFKTFHKLGDADEVVTGLAFTPDGKRLAVASTGAAVTVWDTADGKQVHALPVKGQCRDVAFSPDAKWLAAAVGKSVLVWDAAKGSAPATKLDYKGIVETVAFHADGRLIVKAGKLVTVGTPWAGGGRALVIESKGSPMSVTLSPDGTTLLAAGGKCHARLWDAASGKAGLVLGPDVDDDAWTASFSPDGKTILTSDSEGTVRLWDAATGALRTTWTGPDEGCTVGGCFSADGKRVAAQFDELRLYEVGSANGNAEPAATLPFVADEGCLAFSPDGAFLAAGSDAALMVWAM